MNSGNSKIVLSFQTIFQESDERPEKRSEGTELADKMGFEINVYFRLYVPIS